MARSAPREALDGARMPTSPIPALPRRVLALLALATVAASAPTLAPAAAPRSAMAGETGAPGTAPSARELLERAKSLDRSSRAWKDREQRLALAIRDGRGGERRRDLVMKTLRGEGGEDKTITVFLSPAEVRGTAFLQFAHRDRDAEQWLWLPALGRSRQISSGAREESFVGTDFSYRDLELLTDVIEWSEEEAASRLLATESLDGREVARIELVPRRKDVGYRRIVILLETGDLVLRRMEMFGEEDAPRKVLRLDEVRTIGVVPTAGRLEMTKPASGTATVVEVADVRYDQGLPASLFTQGALEHAGDGVEE